jgi:homocysteine S-methyltransferase
MYRNALPQLSGEVFLTDSGIETDLIFNSGFELPEFAAFVLVDDDRGRAARRSTSSGMSRSRSGAAAA